MEEIGCKVEVAGELIATVEEWQGDLHQISFCYAANLLQDVGSPALTEEEVEDGLKHKWVAFEKAAEEMKGAKPTSELGKFIKERDVFFVETYLEKFGQNSH
jgi:8-oxo-dGTP diphosphatase